MIKSQVCAEAETHPVSHQQIAHSAQSEGADTKPAIEQIARKHAARNLRRATVIQHVAVKNESLRLFDRRIARLTDAAAGIGDGNDRRRIRRCAWQLSF